MAGSDSRRTLDELLMLECLLLARTGVGAVSPNPLVGSILVKKGRVLSRGFHRRFGGPHAEPEAIASAGGASHGSTLYVNLEPCNHQGKTPPCTAAIINAGISRVVIGMVDPNPLVAGRGIRRLRAAGIRVDVGVLNAECRKLNEAFAKHVTTGIPFVTLKIAQTLDGKVADAGGTSKWISDASSRDIVLRLRNAHDAVLIGAETLRRDNPRLTLHGHSGHDPIRIVVSGSLKLPVRARLFSSASNIPTIVITLEKSLEQQRNIARTLERKGVELLALPATGNMLRWKRILKVLGRRNISSVLVEGGARVFGSILSENAADKGIFFVAPKLLGSGKDAFSGYQANLGSARVLTGTEVRRSGPDIMISAYFKE